MKFCLADVLTDWAGGDVTDVYGACEGRDVDVNFGYIFGLLVD